MGGFGTFKLASQFPDLFARAQPTVGTMLYLNGCLRALDPVPDVERTADDLVRPGLFRSAPTRSSGSAIAPARRVRAGLSATSRCRRQRLMLRQ